MKRILYVAVCTLLAVCVFFPLSASAADIIESGSCGDNAEYTLDSEGHLTITGSGMICYGPSPWEASCKKITSVTIGEGITDIGGDAFSKCSNLKSVSVPDSVKIIEERGFNECTSLENIVLPEGLEELGPDVFTRCSSLESINIPASTVTIGAPTFEGCNSLKSINVAADNPDFCSKDGVLFSKDGTLLISYPGGKGQRYTVPSGTVSIGDYAFMYLDNVTDVVIPEGVRSIGVCAFLQCSSLASVKLPDSLETIGVQAFLNCKKLKDMSLSSGIREIGESAFTRCESLASVTIPENIEVLGGNSFEGCSSLTEFSFPDSLTVVRGGVLQGCSKLRTIHIGSGIKEIQSWAFAECSSLQGIVIPENVETISYSVFRQCSELAYIEFGKGIRFIDENAARSSNKLKDIYYAGTEEEWSNVEIKTPNDVLLGATVHFESSAPDIHIHTIEKVEKLEPTCTEKGQTESWFCSSCGKFFSDAGGSNEIRFEDTIVPEKGHDWDYGKIIDRATVTSTGVVSHTCRRCGLTRNKMIPELADDYVPVNSEAESAIKTAELAMMYGTESEAAEKAKEALTEAEKAMEAAQANLDDAKAAYDRASEEDKDISEALLTLAEQDYIDTIATKAKAEAVVKRVSAKASAAKASAAASAAGNASAGTDAEVAKAQEAADAARIAAADAKAAEDAAKEAFEAVKTSGFAEGTEDYTLALGALNNAIAERSAADQALAAANSKLSSAIAVRNAKKAEFAANGNAYVDTKLPKVKLSKPKAGKKSMTVKWKKITAKNQKNIKGIEIEYSTDKTFRTAYKFKTVSKKKAEAKIKKLKSKKTYYVRAHTYVIRGGVKYVSKWSTVKKIKVK